MTSEIRRVPPAVLVVAAALAVTLSVPVRAESRAEEDFTPSALLRIADAVVLASPVAGDAALVVEESILGPLAPGARVAPLAEGGREPLAAPAGAVVAVLRRGRDGAWEVPGGTLGLFAAEGGAAGGPAAACFRALVAARGADAGPPAAAPARAALVAAAREGDARLRAAAAMDLLLDPARLAGATDGERAAIADAFRGSTPGERARVHLARLLGRTGGEGVAAALLAALDAADGDLLARPVGEALGRLDDAPAFAVLAGRTASIDPGVRRRAVAALAASASPRAAAALTGSLADRDAAIRVEAAIGLGALRSAEAAPALLARFRGDGPETSSTARRAVAWALAQCDAPAAWEALAEAAERDPDPRFRAFVRETIANPRRSFVR